MAAHVAGRTFDHRPRFDDRSLNFRAAPRARALPATGRLWTHGPVLDQGVEGACVGFGCAGATAAAPASRTGVNSAYARNWYLRAQRFDQWPGEAYEGTSVLAGCLVGRQRKAWTGFRWAKNPAELAAGIMDDTLGPAVLGIQWSTDLYDIPRSGIMDEDVRLDPELGHCVLLFGFLPAWAHLPATLRADLGKLGLADAAAKLNAPSFPLLNSWGSAWGDGGRALAPLPLVQRWFAARGEFALPENRTAATRKAPTMTAPAEQPTEEYQGDTPPPAPDRPGDETLHVTAADVRQGDRILDPPEELGQESATVVGPPRHVLGWAGRRVTIPTTAGSFQLGAADPVTVRREG